MYRTQAIITVPRWKVTRWRKLHVRIARVFFNLRSKYAARREYNDYLRRRDEWNRLYGNIRGRDIIDGRVKLPIPPMPVPPPTQIME